MHSVVHVHPNWIVALSCVGRDIMPIFGAYDPHGFYLAAKGIPTYESSVSIHDIETGRRVVEVMGDSEVCILRGHGVVVAGTSVEKALRSTIALHELGHMNWLAAAVGSPQTISEPDMKRFRRRAQQGREKVELRRDGVTPFWHYMQRRIERNERTSHDDFI